MLAQQWVTVSLPSRVCSVSRPLALVDWRLPFAIGRFWLPFRRFRDTLPSFYSMKTPHRFALVALTSALLVSAPLATAADSPLTNASFPQISPKATLEQRVGLTDVKIEYFRPGVRGRKIFGTGLVLQPNGEVWRVGANNPTKVTFSAPVKFGGQQVPAGSYGLYAIPGDNDWSVMLAKIGERDWGAYAYKQENDAARVQVKPTKLAETVETFTLNLANVTHESATLEISWDKTKVSVPLVFDLSEFKKQVADVMNGDFAKKPYMGASMFTLETNGDLKSALAWMDEGLKANPAAFWMVYRKGLILEKMGDKAGAKAAAEASKAAAQSAAGQPQLLKDEYVRLNDALLARLK